MLNLTSTEASTSKELNFTCQSCHKSFVTKVALLHHSKMKHEQEKTHVCKICNARYADVWGLKHHQISHSDARPYQCDLCSARFKMKAILKRHKLTHTGERPFSCSVCGDSFKRKYELKHHMKKQHGTFME